MPRKVKSLLPLALVVLGGALYAPPALASHTQQSIIQDDIHLKSDPVHTLGTFQQLGVNRVRVSVTWADIAPNASSSHPPPGFNGSNPASYPAGNWVPYDALVRAAQAAGIAVNFVLTSPVPTWAEGPGNPGGSIGGVWRPSPRLFGQFVHAVGARYSGSYKPAGSATPLPAVRFWSIWNEPNYGRSLAPQANCDACSTEVSATEYRALVAAAWGSLNGTGHHAGRDTILIGEVAPRGIDNPGRWNGWKPLRFLRALYCVNSSYHQLRGRAAAALGCPTTAGASRRFRAQNPGLFNASGFADHPYTLQGHPLPPTVATNLNGGGRSDPDFTDLPVVGRLEGVLNRLNAIYGSHKHYPIWNTEYGYRTIPPDHAGVSPRTAAVYINWAEYLSWRNPGISSFMQYLLVDPPGGSFASGLEYQNGSHKPSFDAFRMPLFLPVTSTRHGHTLEVWGAARPARFAARGQRVQIQFQRGSRGPFRTIKTITITNPQGYFDVRAAFPASGSVRIAWTQSNCPPTAPGTVSCLVRGVIYSRTQSIAIH